MIDAEHIKKQFYGFLATPSLRLKNDILEYPLFHTDNVVPSLSSEEIPTPVNSVLGKRMEEFFRFYVQNFSEEEVLAFNEQIIEEKITIGELDFLLKNSRTSKVSHVEMVYKFYLYDPGVSRNEIECWVGPNKKDFLVKKLRRLKQRQFPLLQQPATAKLLADLDLSTEDIDQKLCFKANLFLPFGEEAAPKDLSYEPLAGFWIKEKDFTKSKFGRNKFFSPRKQDWPILPDQNKEWVSYHDFLPQVRQLLRHQQSPLVWMKNEKNSCFRFFIVWW